MIKFSRCIHKTMEHPVPQNVTSFEFHLVGDMTLKQFAYLAAGLGSGYLIFVLLFSTHPFIAIPTIICFVLTGVALAFLPILDRPLDHWVIAFFKAVYSPTKGSLPFNEQTIRSRLQIYLSSLGAMPPQPLPASPLPKLVRLAPPIKPIIAPPSPQAPQPILQPPPMPPAPSLPLKEPKKQLILTSVPNVINGVIGDEQGNSIEGVIVVIHNSEGVPVRALKTNKLGQFSGATPLAPGSYTISLEKEGFDLGSVSVTLRDEVLSPLLLTIKKGGL